MGTVEFNKLSIIFLVAAIAIAGCTQQSPSPTPTQNVQLTIVPTSTPSATNTGQATVTATPTPTATAQGGVKEFTMTAKQWEFQPSEITVKKGDTVRLKITSIDVNHGFALPDFNVNARLEPNKEVVVEFTADKAGTFSFFCSVVCGSGHSGMKGTLIVED